MRNMAASCFPSTKGAMRSKADLAQSELRADRAERWLVLIRQEIEERLMPSFVAMHDRSTPPERIERLDCRPRG
jgi:hypothetical protein